MKEFIEKLIEKLGELPTKRDMTDYAKTGRVHDYVDVEDVKKIVNQLAEEYKTKQLSRYATTDYIVDDEYCWQKCCSIEMCGECERLHNGSIDYFDSLDDYAEEYSSKSGGVENNGWIPVSERLPEEGQRVIACFVHETVMELCFYDGTFSGMFADYGTDEVIAWMPLPEPYQPQKPQTPWKDSMLNTFDGREV